MYWKMLFNSLWPSDVIWWHRNGSTLAQSMACCLTAPSHCLNQYSFISKAQWHPSEGNFKRNTSAINNYKSLKITHLWFQSNLTGANELIGYLWNEAQVFNFKCFIILTHWGRVTHICVGKLTIIGSDNGLSPVRRQAIIWTNAGILLIRPLGTNFSEILIGIQTFSFKKMHLKMSSAKWRPFVSASMC